MITWGYFIPLWYLTVGALVVWTMNVHHEWFWNLLERIDDVEPGFKQGALEESMKMGSTPHEIEMKANVLIFLGWPLFVVIYTVLYLMVRRAEKWDELMEYMEEKREAVLEAWALSEDERGRKEIVWAAESNYRAADAHFQKRMRVRWWQHVLWWIRYRQRMHVVTGGGIFSSDPVENLRMSVVGKQVVKMEGCEDHTIPALSCPECRKIPAVQKIVDDLKRDGFVGEVEDNVPRMEATRERRQFRLTFDENGKVGKFEVQAPKPGPDGKTVVADCCLDCAQSDQSAQVTDASLNAQHLIGLVPARSSFLERDTKNVFTNDGKAGFVAGYLVRDVC